MNIKTIPELDIINDIVIAYQKESKQNYLEGKKKLDFKSEIGLSSVMDSPLINYMRQVHPEVESYTSDHLDVMVGDFLHNEIQRKIMQVRGANSYIEHPLPIKAKGEIGEWTLSGRIDILEMISDKEIKIGDIKITSAYQVQTIKKELYKYEQTGDWRELKHKYIYQLNAYAEGMRQQGYDVKELYLLVYCKHWTKRLAWGNPSFPQFSFFYTSIPILTSEQIQEYLTECVNRHQAAEMGLQEDVLPICDKKDLWLDDHKEWAVMTKGKKKALALFNDKKEAEKYSEEYYDSYLEHRPMGLSIRCRDYCLYSEVCPQYQRQKQGEENGK